MKLAVIYWTMSGNTKIMAQAIKEGSKEDCDIFEVSTFDTNKINQYDAFAFGCPAMGAETLEESEFEPFFNSIISKLTNKKILLFGSYDWGDGEWMRSWEKLCKEHGLNLISNGIISNLEPSKEILENLKEFGNFLVNQ